MFRQPGIGWCVDCFKEKGKYIKADYALTHDGVNCYMGTVMKNGTLCFTHAQWYNKNHFAIPFFQQESLKYFK